jgi:lipopolysaccharide assembly outer membrane protein LptD (OstA)
MSKKIIFFIFISNKISIVKKKTNQEIIFNEKKVLAPNIIKDVSYAAKDNNGNEYVINAKEGEIDLSDKNIIFLKEIEAFIKLKGKNEIIIKSNFGKYNILNHDTIFNENVLITYDNNKLEGENLDFSIERKLMLLSKNIKYKNLSNFLMADVIEIDLETKDTKIYMNDLSNKLIIKNLN